MLNGAAIKAISKRTFLSSIHSPIAYVVAIFFYGFVGTLFGLNFFAGGQGTVAGIGYLAPWILWFVIPALTMGLISDETRSGTFEQLSTLPITDWEIVLGKYLGFCALATVLIGGLSFYPILVSLLVDHPAGIDGGPGVGILAGLLFLSFFFGSLGLWASSLAKNQVVVLILGMIFCTFFFFLGQLYSVLPGILARLVDYLGVTSHVETLARGVWDVRDLFYFVSMSFIFLYFTVQRLSTRRF